MPTNSATPLTNRSADMHSGGPDSPVRFICMLNRTGSTWLCEMLNQSGLGYVAGEWFRPTNARVPFDPSPEGREAHWQNLLAEHRASGTRLVIKCNIGQMKLFQPLMGEDVVRQSRFVFLRREDLLGQAISQFLLELREENRPEAIGVDLFEPERITKLMKIYDRGNQQWRKWLEQNVSQFTNVSYETMVESPVQVLHQVISHLDSPELCGQVRGDVEYSTVKSKNQVPFATQWREAAHLFQAGKAWRDALVTPVEGKLRLS